MGRAEVGREQGPVARVGRTVEPRTGGGTRTSTQSSEDHQEEHERDHPARSCCAPPCSPASFRPCAGLQGPERSRVVDLNDVDQGLLARALGAAEEVVVDASARVEHGVRHAVLAAATGAVVERHGDDRLAVRRVGDAKAREATEARAVRGEPVDGLLASGTRAPRRTQARLDGLRETRGDAVVARIGLHVPARVDVAAEARDVVVAVVDGGRPVRARAREVRGGRPHAD